MHIDSLLGQVLANFQNVVYQNGLGVPVEAEVKADFRTLSWPSKLLSTNPSPSSDHCRWLPSKYRTGQTCFLRIDPSSLGFQRPIGVGSKITAEDKSAADHAAAVDCGESVGVPARCGRTRARCSNTALPPPPFCRREPGLVHGSEEGRKQIRKQKQSMKPPSLLH